MKCTLITRKKEHFNYSTRRKFNYRYPNFRHSLVVRKEPKLTNILPLLADDRCIKAIDYFIKQDGIFALFTFEYTQEENKLTQISERYILYTTNHRIYIYIEYGENLIIEEVDKRFHTKNTSPEIFWEKLLDRSIT